MHEAGRPAWCASPGGGGHEGRKEELVPGTTHLSRDPAVTPQACRCGSGARRRSTMVHKIFSELRPYHRSYTILHDHDPLPEKVWLYPEEGWARASCNSHWLIKTPWWSRRHCYILEVEGTKRHKTVGRVLPAREGEVVVEGTFRGLSEGDFRLVLTTTVTLADLQRGYHMTGSLERGDRKLGQWQTTHLAVTKRSGFS